MPSIVRIHEEPKFYERVLNLPTTGASGYIPIDIPFPALYIAVINQSQATLNYADGLITLQPPTAIPVQANGFISTNIRDTQHMTLFWSGGPLSNNPTVIIRYSNEPIPVQAGNLSPAGQNVQVSNFPATQPVSSADGSLITVGTKTDTAVTAIDATPGSVIALLKGVISKLAGVVLAAGTAIIGKVGIDGTTDGTTNRVVAKISQTNGENNVVQMSGTTTTAITTATTTILKSASGVIGTLVNAGGATSGSITVYDNTAASGKIVWSGTLTAGQALSLNMPCSIGITVVTAAANTLAVSWA